MKYQCNKVHNTLYYVQDLEYILYLNRYYFFITIVEMLQQTLRAIDAKIGVEGSQWFCDSQQ